MQKSPHMLIEGIVIATWAAGINRAFIYIRGEYALPGRHPRGGDRRGAATPATSARTSSARSHSSQLVLHRGAGAYICGEETGLLDSLEGKRGNPRLKPPFPAIEGLYHGPTLINNVETLCTVPAHHPDGRRRVREDRHRDLDRHQAGLGLGRRAAARQLRDRARDPEPRDHLRPRRRPARGPRGQALVPGRLELAGPDRGRPRHSLRLRHDGEGRARCSARARSSSSTTPTRCSRSR